MEILALASLTLCCSQQPAPAPWQAIVIPTDAEFTGMWFSDSLNGWITGGGYSTPGGIVGSTHDGGRTWRFQSGVVVGARENFRLHRLRFWNSLRGCVASDHGILLTEDGGESWRRPSSGGAASSGVFDVHFLDEQNGWAVGSASILRTNDGGETWQALVRSTAENGYLSGTAIHFVDGMQGWLAGHHGQLMRSTDGGQSWMRVELPLRDGERPTLWDVTFSDPLHGWVVGEQGSIFHTQNGGVSWLLQETGVPVVRAIPKGEPPRPRDILPELEMEPSRLCLAAVHFVDQDRGCAVGYYADVAESIVLRTQDGGAQWDVEHVQPGEILRSVFVLDAEHAWAAGDRARTQSQVVLRYTGVTR
jgi:photosystem II stability/assembly factor-like uncharacterized protein